MGKRRAVAAGCAGLVKRGAFGAGQVFEAKAGGISGSPALQGQAQAGCAWQHINL